MQHLRFCIYSLFAFFPSGAAVCAQHIRHLPKGEPRVLNIYSFHLLFCLPLKHASKAKPKMPATSAFPHPFIPSPGPARTAALRPQFALEASKCDFSAFQKSSYFLLRIFLAKIGEIMDFGLPKPFQNLFKMPPKTKSQKTCDFSSILAPILMLVARAEP